MADSQENYQSYRVVWKISDEFDSNTTFLRSEKFQIGNSEWSLEMCKQPCYRFALCGPLEDRRQVRRTSYYLLSDMNKSLENMDKYLFLNADLNEKLENLNKFLTCWLSHGIPGEKTLVCAIDVACEASLRNSEHWLEGSSRKHGRIEINMFTKMTQGRVAEIAEIIKKCFGDTLMNKANNNFQALEPPLDLHENVALAVIKNETTEIAAVPIDDISVRSSISFPSQAEILLTKSVQCFKEKMFCDITIQVLPGGHTIRAHKLVLFSGSTVWKQLLTTDQDLSIITVPDLDPEIVEALVTFIYDGSLPKPSKDTHQLLIAAATYGVDGLKSWCEQQLIATITIEVAINMIVLAHQYNSPSLFKNAITFVQQNINVLKQRDEWKSLFFSYPELAMELVNQLY